MWPWEPGFWNGFSAQSFIIGAFFWMAVEHVFRKMREAEAKPSSHPMDTADALYVECSFCELPMRFERKFAAESVRTNSLVEKKFGCQRCSHDVITDLVRHPWVKELIVRAELLKERNETTPQIVEEIRQGVRDEEEKTRHRSAAQVVRR